MPSGTALKSGFTLIELLVVVGVIGLLSALAVVSITSVRSRARDTKRITDIRTIVTALESYRDTANQLPDNTDDDAGGWDVGNSRLPGGDTFIRSLNDSGILRPSVETFFAPDTYASYRYFKYVDEGNCGGTYAILALRLEGTKQSFGASNTLESCYMNNFNAVPVDDYWLAYMIRQ